MPHTEIPISPWLMTKSVWTVAAPLSLSRLPVFHILHIFNAALILCLAVTSIPWTLTTFRGVICSDTCFHSVSQCSIGLAPRVSWCREVSSGVSGSVASGSILCNDSTSPAIDQPRPGPFKSTSIQSEWIFDRASAKKISVRAQWLS